MAVLVLCASGELQTCTRVAEASLATDATMAYYDSAWSTEGMDSVIMLYPSGQERSLDIVREARAGAPVVVVERPHEQLAAMFIANAVEEIVFDNEMSQLPRALARAQVRREATALMERAARIDPLTELLNRRGIGELIPRLCARHEATTAVLVDVDDFKGVNTRLGHAGGDKLLRTLADTVRELIRPTDVAARTGGDEFVILLPGTDLQAASQVISRLRVALYERGVAASFGIAGAAGAGSLDELIMRTQTCLAVSKAGGKNRLAARTPEGEVVILHSL